MIIHDLSPPIHPETVVWPGDQGYVPRWSARITPASPVNVGAILMSTHTGSHADAPLHYAASGAPIDELPLLHYVGPCLVVEHRGNQVIGPEAVSGLERGHSRILFKTRAEPPPSRWTDAFAHLSPRTIDALADMGVRLVGIDSPSVDPASSKALEAHHRLAARGMSNLENLDLSSVEPGAYFLVAAPLKLQGMDAAPVRALLIEGIG